MNSLSSLPTLLARRFKSPDDLLGDYKTSGPAPNWPACLTLVAIQEGDTDSGELSISDVAAKYFEKDSKAFQSIMYFIYGFIRRSSNNPSLKKSLIKKNGTTTFPVHIYKSMLNDKGKAKGNLGWVLLSKTSSSSDRKIAIKLLNLIGEKCYQPPTPRKSPEHLIAQKPIAARENETYSNFYWIQSKYNKFIFLLLIFFVVLSSATIFIVKNPEILRISRKSGHFSSKASLIDKSNPKIVREHTYDFYAQGNFSEAIMWCRKLNAMPSADDSDRAYGNYIMGLSLYSGGEFEEALLYLSLAEIYYQRKGWWTHLFNVLNEMARTKLRLNKIQDSEKLLENSLEVFNKSDNPDESYLAWWYEIKLQILIAQNFRRKALEVGETLLEICDQSDKPRLASTYLWLSYVYALNGELYEADFWCDEADLLIDSLNDEKRRMFNLTNKIYIRRCRGEDFSLPVQKIFTYLENKSNLDLKYQLDVALSVECPEL